MQAEAVALMNFHVNKEGLYLTLMIAMVWSETGTLDTQSELPQLVTLTDFTFWGNGDIFLC